MKKSRHRLNKSGLRRIEKILASGYTPKKRTLRLNALANGASDATGRTFSWL